MTPEQVQEIRKELEADLKDLGITVNNASPDDVKEATNKLLLHDFRVHIKKAAVQLNLFAAGQVPTPQEAITIYNQYLDREYAIAKETGRRMLLQYFDQAKAAYAELNADLQKQSIIITGP